jgi:SAM-dependent methyltransferase
VAPEAIEAVKSEVRGLNGPILLLGLTRPLMDASNDLIAIDRSVEMIRNASGAVRAVAADWTALPFAPGSFAGCIGDGSLISFEFPDRLRSVLNEVARCLKPGGRFACRVFLRPDPTPGLGELMRAARSGRLAFQHFKFKFAMAMAAESGLSNIAVAALPELLATHLPDRDELAVQTGWDRREIDTIDVYRSSDATYCFPSRAELASVVPPVFSAPRFVPIASHPFGMEWPVVVLDR